MERLFQENLDKLRCNLYEVSCNFDEPISFIHSLDDVEILFRVGRWVGVAGEIGTSAKVWVEVEAELGKNQRIQKVHLFIKKIL